MTKQITLDLSDELHDAIQTSATQQYRSFEQQALWLLACQIGLVIPHHRKTITNPDAEQALRNALLDLHLHAGRPSTRTIARAVGFSHASVHEVTSPRATRVPSWDILEPVVNYLGGDTERFRQLWIATQIPPEH